MKREKPRKTSKHHTIKLSQVHSKKRDKKTVLGKKRARLNKGMMGVGG